MTASNQQAAATPIDDYSSSAIFIGRKKQIHISKKQIWIIKQYRRKEKEKLNLHNFPS